jgi:hypothetical protein
MFRRPWLLASLLLCPACQDPDFGAGPIVLSPDVQASFEGYKARDAPLYFAVTEDGSSSSYIYCVGGVNCTASTTRMATLNRCRSANPGRECKLYAIGRNVVWRDTGPRPAPVLSASERLIRDCVGGRTPQIRIETCSEAIDSAALPERDKRGPHYVRARAYEATGSLAAAERDYRAVLALDPDHTAAQGRLEGLLAPAAAPD